MKTAIYKYEGPGIYMGATVIVIESSLRRATTHINKILLTIGLSTVDEEKIEKIDIVSGKEVFFENGDY